MRTEPKALLARTAALVRRIIGAPDYDAYLVHATTCRPGSQPMSRDEFLKDRLDARYSRPGQRCC